MEGPYTLKARTLVFDYVRHILEKTDTHVTFFQSDVYVVWFSKVLNNWKALVSTSLPDGMYYEVTYNGEKGETYIDAYKKFDNVCIPDGMSYSPVISAYQELTTPPTEDDAFSRFDEAAKELVD